MDTAEYFEDLPWERRCQAVHGDSGQCVRPDGHDVGPHMAGDGKRWTDQGVLF